MAPHDPPHPDSDRGHKFHIRVLALAVGSLDVFLFDECRVLIAPVSMERSPEGRCAYASQVSSTQSEEEDSKGGVLLAPGRRGRSTVTEIQGRKDNVGDGSMAETSPLDASKQEDGDRLSNNSAMRDVMHANVTNQSFNKSHPAYDESWNNQPLSSCAALDGGGAGPHWTVKGGQSLWSQMRRIAASLFARLGTERRRFFALPNCYELFGLDFVVDYTGRVLLLEANPDPSLGMFGLEDEALIRQLSPLRFKDKIDTSLESDSGAAASPSPVLAKETDQVSCGHQSSTMRPMVPTPDNDGPGGADGGRGCVPMDETKMPLVVVPPGDRWKLVYSASALRQLRRVLANLRDE
eukprot:CAMPEP_0185759376 /NCGR_PEP_ID=MMETSP1174-20130828/18126_1 /TAXON_ID=35687 /ORGANISM="Dictyocha speculum, Strain CCMP1381" /LENGTH=350 /DNA_ID=CAMNT_0028439691 /DNA_START=104 /DNA_END=1156 /DNA_ORIENTATION=-